MIFHIRKEIFRKGEDFPIKPLQGELLFTATSMKKSYYLYDKKGLQVGQIVFEKGKATILVPESAAVVVTQNEFSYLIGNRDAYHEKDVDKKFFKQNNAINMIYGTPDRYKYDIYEKLPENKQPQVVANIIPDIEDDDFYKVRINGGENILKILMIILAIDKMHNDPNNKY